MPKNEKMELWGNHDSLAKPLKPWGFDQATTDQRDIHRITQVQNGIPFPCAGYSNSEGLHVSIVYLTQ